ncbi:uncharacterized protein LOC106649211 [Trichogramma pretiosum]|uniref:Uncharacterized protein n=1 Tax=Trichogramma kaykai TaxID=54128 RepID=A0ABD2WVU8_9HYME|nr:uncharacterized protein LOC106649211 [Trichogramma pretiosum]
MFKYVVFGLLVASAIASPAPSSELDCDHAEDMLMCLGVKAAATLERAARSADVNLVDGITFVRDTPVERTGKALKSESEIMSELPADSTEKAMAVATMMYDNAANFLQSHSLKVDMSEDSVVGRVLKDPTSLFSHKPGHNLGGHLGGGHGGLGGSHKKHKKMLMPLITLIGVKLLALAPVFLGGLALLVGKAVFVSKIALLIAGVLAFQKFFGAGSQLAGGFPGAGLFGKNNAAAPIAYEHPAAAYAQAQGQGYQYRRSFEKDAQQLAYAAQAPAAEAH